MGISFVAAALTTLPIHADWPGVPPGPEAAPGGA
jgi:hypothetical protein